MDLSDVSFGIGNDFSIRDVAAPGVSHQLCDWTCGTEGARLQDWELGDKSQQGTLSPTPHPHLVARMKSGLNPVFKWFEEVSELRLALKPQTR